MGGVTWEDKAGVAEWPTSDDHQVTLTKIHTFNLNQFKEVG